MAGILYLCATPIGNLEDMTFRAVRILQEVDLIAAEDTRNSVKLLNHFDIHTPMTSYHEFNKVEKARYLVDKMREGTNVALITDAGTPGISDPGEELVRQCYEAGIELFREAQRRQRELADAAADIDGGWSLEYGGLRLYRPIAGTAEFEGLGTEQMRGVVSLASGGEIVFEDGRVRVSRGGEERLRELSPEEWSALSDDFMNGTTYDLDMVTYHTPDALESI